METEKQQLVQQLLEMGFSENAVGRSIRFSEIKTFESCTQWLVDHSGNEDFNDPLPPQQEVESQQGGSSQSISNLVNQEQAAQLMSLGYSKSVSEKSLFMVQGKGVEAALSWIEENKNEPDFEEELRIVGQEERPKLSEEEAKQKARELQVLLRKKREEREKAEAIEREKERIRMNKELSLAKKQMEEASLKRDFDKIKQEKIKEEQEKQQMLHQLELDRIERFGKAAATAPKKDKSIKEQTNYILRQMKVVYSPLTSAELLKTCFTTIKIYLENILKNPQEIKFRQINLNNPNFKKRVGDLIGGTNLLETVGFKSKDDGFLYLEEIDTKKIQELIEILNNQVF